MNSPKNCHEIQMSLILVASLLTAVLEQSLGVFGRLIVLKFCILSQTAIDEEK